MNTQLDLFEVGADIDPMRVFPQFKIERPNCDYSGHVKLTDMPSVLQKLGFRVGQMRYHVGEILVFPVGECKEQVTLFEVSYPEGWMLTEDKSSTIYIGDENPVRQILDAHGHLRGLVFCGWDKIPLSAEVYTRYSVWGGVPLNFAQVGFERDGVRSIVVDRTKMDPQHPNKLDVVEHIDRRWLFGEKYPELRDMPAEKRSAWIGEHVPHEERFRGIWTNGSTLWLDEHFPDWRDPTAYWPR